MKLNLIAASTVSLAMYLVSTNVLANNMSCNDQQVRSAVMDSARKDLPSPYSNWDLKGAENEPQQVTSSNSENICSIKLLFNDGTGGELASIDTYFSLKKGVSLSSLKVTLDKPASTCKAITFAKGAVSTSINASIAPNQSNCFTLQTGANQTAKVAVTSTLKNTAITIDGIGDDQEKFEFSTKATTYMITVFQDNKSNKKDHYTLTAEVR